MHDLHDTIVAVSSPPGGIRSIVRITGPEAVSVREQFVHPDAPLDSTAPTQRALPPAGERLAGVPGEPGVQGSQAIRHVGIRCGFLRITDALVVGAGLYFFLAPHSYTGEDLVEIHLDASPAIVEALLQRLLAQGLRPAGPGEFTARAYLHGKLDLSQAEAVNEVISSSNRLQLAAAERLLAGRLTEAAAEVRSALLDILSLIEAGLDFSGEEIEFISAEQARERLADIRRRLEALLAGSIQYETLIDLPAVGIAGAPNAGKSSLLNALLGWERSIVASQPKTTRDVLSGILTTDRFQCVLFDCAGLIAAPDDILDELAQQAAIEALQSCRAVLFCVDVTKPNWNEDLIIRALIQPKAVIPLATKCDLLPEDALDERMQELKAAFDGEFLAVSATRNMGLRDLAGALKEALARSEACGSVDAARPACSDAGKRSAGEDTPLRTHYERSERAPHVALTARHKQAVGDAIESVREAAAEVQSGSDEVAVMMLRAAHQALSEIEQQPIDEQVLDRIFSRFCIGK